jgi:hypothetical protein
LDTPLKSADGVDVMTGQQKTTTKQTGTAVEPLANERKSKKSIIYIITAVRTSRHSRKIFLDLSVCVSEQVPLKI